jgi:hypothetical protein
VPKQQPFREAKSGQREGDELMNTQEKSVKTGGVVMHVMSVFALIMALAWIFLTEIVFVSDFAAYTGQTYADYLSSSPQYARIYIITKKLLGVQLLSTSILMMFVTQRSYKKGEKWSWYALLMAGIVTWGSLLGYKVLIGYFKLSSSSMTFIVGAILLVIGLALPARTILGNKEQTE